MIAYQTAWFKANHPVDFLAASMTLDKPNTDKLAEFANEARRMGISVEPPSVVNGCPDFEVHRRRTARSRSVTRSPPSRASATDRLAASSRRAAARPFKDLADFAGRLNPRDANKRVLESLCAAGAFDELDPDRAKVFAGIETLLAVAPRAALPNVPTGRARCSAAIRRRRWLCRRCRAGR